MSALDTHDAKELTKVALARLMISLPLSVFVRGHVLLAMWGWFAVPLGAPIIDLWAALGISTAVNYLIPSKSGSDDDKSGPWVELLGEIGSTLGYGGIAYLMAYGFHWMMVP